MFSLLSLGNAERVGSFMVIGDWGYDKNIHCNPGSGCGMSPKCQQNIGNKMKEWVAQNTDVKFVLNLGDSFYPAGVTSHDDPRWDSSWKNVYGDTITNLRWYSVYGNHDYEGRDRCACGDPAQDPTICAQRLTSGMNGWYMPELYYSDTTYLKELGVEIVALDTNSVAESACKYLPSGCSRGTCWANLNARYSASMDMLAKRLKETTADNLLVMNHYPTNYFGGGRKPYIDALKGGSTNGAQVYHYGGHVHFVEDNWPSYQNLAPAKQWLVGGGGGWGCDGSAQGFAVGIVNKDASGKFSVTMQSVLVDHSTCCYHHVELGEGEKSAHWQEENDNAIYRTDEWWEEQLKMNGLWEQTCGGLQCPGRRELLEKYRGVERLEGTSESPAKDLLADEVERESGADYSFSKFFHETIESIRSAKAAKSAEHRVE